MNKTILAVGIICVGAALSLPAADFASGGYTVEGRGTEDGKTVYALRDPAGFPFTAVLAGEPTGKQIGIMGAAGDIIRSMRHVPVSSLRIAFTGDRAEIILIPRPFSYKGQELASFMPSGMQFYYDDYMEYDFRMTAENLFFRVRGQYFSEEQFLDRLVEAARNPFAFIQANDPEFIFRKFLELEKRLEEYASNGVAARDELAGGISSAKTEMGEKIDSLAAESAGRGREFLLLRYALLVLNNRGFFGSIRLPSEKGIERLVQLKKGEPGLSMEEAGARLRAEGIEMSSKEVFLVFSVYFNEFK